MCSFSASSMLAVLMMTGLTGEGGRFLDVQQSLLAELALSEDGKIADRLAAALRSTVVALAKKADGDLRRGTECNPKDDKCEAPLACGTLSRRCVEAVLVKGEIRILRILVLFQPSKSKKPKKPKKGVYNNRETFVEIRTAACRVRNPPQYLGRKEDECARAMTRYALEMAVLAQRAALNILEDIPEGGEDEETTLKRKREEEEVVEELIPKRTKTDDSADAADAADAVREYQNLFFSDE